MRYFSTQSFLRYEQSPTEILSVVKECIEQAVEKLIKLGGDPSDIVAIGITNQRETTIVWDAATGEPLYNAIIWSDIRTISTVEQLLEKVPNNTKNKNYLKPLCGLPLSTYFSAVKLKWLLDNAPRVKSTAKSEGSIMFGTVDTWVSSNTEILLSYLSHCNSLTVDLEFDWRNSCYRCHECIKNYVDES